MMDRTDRHYRAFMRSLTRHPLLYTEMVVTKAILHGDRQQLLGYSPIEHPLALQLGGDDPVELAECARIAEGMGYQEVNINIGCPSERVQKGSFGACLMREPDTVARSVRAMREATGLPVTVKHRIGVDDLDQYEDMVNFVRRVAEAGCDRFSIHARKAWLKGLSPKQNRTVPPLRYAEVYRLKAEHPELHIEINGGVRTLEEARDHLQHVDAVMIGRAAYEQPFQFAEADQKLFGDTRPVVTRRQAIEAFLPYLDQDFGPKHKLHHITRHLLNLFSGVPGNKAWKRALMEGAQRGAPGPEVVLDALAKAEAVLTRSMGALTTSPVQDIVSADDNPTP